MRVCTLVSERLAEAGIELFLGRKCDSYDNALAERINGLYTAELTQRRAPSRTREAVELATLERCPVQPRFVSACAKGLRNECPPFTIIQ
jgi:transposase InsO family protein